MDLALFDSSDGLTHSSSIKRPVVGKNEENECVDGRLKGIDPKIIELIMNEVSLFTYKH